MTYLPKFDPNLLTNADASQQSVYEAAIIESGFSEIYIDHPHAPLNAPDYIGIWCTSRVRSFSPFWRIFERLLVEAKAREAAINSTGDKDATS